MKGLFNKRFRCIYILCPEKKVTGGTEALHQLRYYLELVGFNSYIVYYDSINKNKYVNSDVPERYLQYFIEKKNVIHGDLIEDRNDVCVVAPEFSTSMLWKYPNVEKVIWWLSVRYYDGGKFMKYLAFRHWVKETLKKPSNMWKYKNLSNPYDVTDAIHCCASQYAYEYVTTKLKQKAYKLIEPISKDFLDIGPEVSMRSNRNNQIAYNPAKPSKIMEELLQTGEFEFVPIRGMLPVEIAQTMRNVKLYVDFGEFPGPERIPKEAVYNGAEIIVGKRNAACNSFDINIPDSYKIEDYTNLKLVSSKIRQMLENYEKYYQDFEVFRNQICNLAKNFIESINYIWGRNDDGFIS